MSADLSQVQPGWRGTDPDGGTWVLTNAGDSQPWMQMSTGGVWDWRSQEEAEAAGLVRLIPAVGYHYDERGEDVVPDDAAPAPLDPGNPEHLRQVAEFCRKTDVMPWDFYAEAERLDRERAEAEQAATEALEFAEKMSFWGALNANGRSALVSALVEFRAGRAERQEVGQ